MKVIQHVVYSHRKGLRWFFKSTENARYFFVSLYPRDIKYLLCGIFLLIPPLSISHIKDNWNQ